MEKPILILKIGTSSITNEKGFLDKPIMVDLVRQVSILHKDYRIVMVSSGAVGTGAPFIENFDKSIAKRKAAAAIGNPILINRYSTFFDVYNIKIAQSLCERSHFANKKQFDQLKETFEELWSNGIIPIANENDVVSNLEIKFSDNDELATLLAVGFNAEKLLIATATDGVLNSDKVLVPTIKTIDETVLSWATKKSSALGLGGMVSKLSFSRLATRMGIHTTIFGLKKVNSIINAVAGTEGTQCLPQTSSDHDRISWLNSGNILNGKIIIKESAIDEIEKRGIFASDILSIITSFEKGEVFEIQNEALKIYAVASANISAKDLNLNSAAKLADPHRIILI